MTRKHAETIRCECVASDGTKITISQIISFEASKEGRARRFNNHWHFHGLETPRNQLSLNDDKIEREVENGLKIGLTALFTLLAVFPCVRQSHYAIVFN